ncbi:MAG TPA: nuclease-related domain-containing protein [Roseiflexaceae bacterium]|nr:nuclease-related domain-containing protein [Roseiflexaceae bacterium]
MQPSISTADELLEQARASARRDDHAASRELLRQYLTRQHALTWLARVSADPEEARAAAQLALHLNPDDEIAQRALASVGQPVEPGAAGDRVPEVLPPAEEPASAEAGASAEVPTAPITLVTGLTLAEARATIWPFDGRNRSIGELLDSRTKPLKDLAWAYGASTSAQVRAACRTILLAELLDQPPAALPRPLRVLGGGRPAEVQEQQHLTRGAFLSGVVILVGAMALGITSWFVVVPPALLLGLFLMLVAVLLLIGAVRWRERQARAFRVGPRGEEQIVEQLRAVLDGRWTLLRNVVVPGRGGGDIDLVLVGPPGVWALEVKAYRGLVRNRGDLWERKTRGGWARLAVHPGKQARASGARLQVLLERGGLKLAWVHPAVIWASSEAPGAEQRGMLLVEGPQTPVWQGDHLERPIDALRGLPAQLDEAQVDQVVAVVRAAVAGVQPATVAPGVTQAS